MLDPIKNFAYGIIQTPPSPATSGISFTLASGLGANFPDPGSVGAYNVVVWPMGVLATNQNAEIVRGAARVGDVFTIVRQQEGTSAMQIGVGYQVALVPTAKTMSDILAAINAVQALIPSFPLSLANGGTGAVTAALARVALGLAIGTDVQAHDADLDTYAATSLDTDGTLAANVDTKIASQKAVKTYVDGKTVSYTAYGTGNGSTTSSTLADIAAGLTVSITTAVKCNIQVTAEIQAVANPGTAVEYVSQIIDGAAAAVGLGFQVSLMPGNRRQLVKLSGIQANKAPGTYTYKVQHRNGDNATSCSAEQAQISVLAVPTT